MTLSSLKLLNRIVGPSEEDRSSPMAAQRHHMATFGIASDPLTHFVVVFAALIHDVSHPGVPNNQLVDNSHPWTKIYGQKSVAEQHSIHVALRLLDTYPELQQCIHSTPAEEVRFHQLLNHSVLATDIMGANSANRWAEAFGGEAPSTNESNDLVRPCILNLKASIVLEQIIQASDVAHTMQHWMIYQRWNERLLHERYRAYQAGESPDPTVDWYEGELRFLDGYVLPLARRLKECDVYGVSSDEYLSHALANREEWEQKGRQVTQDMIQRIKSDVEEQAPKPIAEETSTPILSRAA